jgi:hypothetical protein
MRKILVLAVALLGVSLAAGCAALREETRYGDAARGYDNLHDRYDHRAERREIEAESYR